MKMFLLTISLLGIVAGLSAQKLDSIYFNLYTDSLKKGTYNYINVEGRFSDGRYLPLGDKDLKFGTSAGEFSGNSLFIDSSFKGKKVTVKVTAHKYPALSQELDIYIKQNPENERLPTVDEILNRNPGSAPGRNSRKTKKRG